MFKRADARAPGDAASGRHGDGANAALWRCASDARVVGMELRLAATNGDPALHEMTLRPAVG